MLVRPQINHASLLRQGRFVDQARPISAPGAAIHARDPATGARIPARAARIVQPRSVVLQ